MKILLIVFCVATFSLTWSQDRSSGKAPKKNLVKMNEDQSVLLQAGTSGEVQLIYDNVEGDFIATASFSSGMSWKGESEAGWMFGATASGDKPLIRLTNNYKGETLISYGDSEVVLAPKRFYDVLQIERTADQWIAKAAHWGEPLQTIGTFRDPDMPEGGWVGLYMNSNDSEEKTRVHNIRIDRPVPDGYDPRENGWLGCRLETMDVFSGERKIIFEKDDRFEAPNWMPDGKKLLFNMEGSLFTIPVNGGELQKLNTGFADRNNNDHGISFDGKLLAISHHRDGLPGGGSTVYVLPIEGGTPKMVTEKTPSYWHGWAPNNEEVVYVAHRDEGPGYDIYKKNIHAGEEVRLTRNKNGEHVDGCEYSPDGEYIYYNGSASGTMQIWRMKPDGSDKEQITFDQYNDWFPHISPDGKWIAFLSYPEGIPVNAHPSYKRVMLRLMPVSGGPIKVIAYLYGGQGTINVPSWSPDSQQIAFVSNK